MQVSSGFCDRNVSWVRGPIRKWYCHMCGTRRPHFHLTTRDAATSIARYPWKILESTPMTPFCHVLEAIVTSENASNNWTVEGTCHGAISAKGLCNHFQNMSHLQSKTSDSNHQYVAKCGLALSLSLFLLRITFGAAGKHALPLSMERLLALQVITVKLAATVTLPNGLAKG